MSDNGYAGLLAVANGWKARAETAEAERDALAAHVERIKDCFKSTGATLPSAWQAEMYGLFAQAPKVSLDRLKAEWQAEALERLRELLQETHMDKSPSVSRAAMHVDDAINRVKQECKPLELRRQAEEPTDGHKAN